MRGSLKTRMDAYTEKRDGDACWIWTGHRDRCGYGAIWAGTRVLGAHRIAWELECGPIPAGMCVLHRCDNPSCVRVAHLFIGTMADNTADMHAKGRYRGGVSGERHGMAKLTWVQVEQIRRKLAAGERISRVALEFGIGRTQTRRIGQGERWQREGTEK